MCVNTSSLLQDKITDISDVITHGRNLNMNVVVLVLLFSFSSAVEKDC